MEKIGRRFEGKVAIVTASTQGIGFSIAERLGLEGASVVISSRKQNNVNEAVEKLRARGIQVLGVVCHVSHAQQRKNLIEKTVQPQRAASVPKFGAWDETDPKSGEGFTIIFNKVKEEKQIGAANFPTVPPQTNIYQNSHGSSSSEPKVCVCYFMLILNFLIYAAACFQGAKSNLCGLSMASFSLA
ncbi:hypothetical protein HHK36_023920 [Tetracentron sinense]|uniref:RIN4 pathogenic type III effector avirulence factor Avr cleavage site domain-containing protein n=1 Tax=Tetracentron sinense TaxID=13715 RepID=A0A834YM62_TETSI|nr:hypothetical protein HHK36_023920 [Tetracentron sinense]